MLYTKLLFLLGITNTQFLNEYFIHFLLKSPAVDTQKGSNLFAQLSGPFPLSNKLILTASSGNYRS